MSAETDLQNMLSHASAATVAMSAKAEALVNDAVRALEPFNRFPKGPDFSPKESGIGVTGTVGGMQPGDEPNFPKLPNLTLPTAPTLRDIEEVFESFSETMPTLTMPSFYYTPPPPIQLRTFRDPSIDTTVTIPDSPDTEVAVDPVTMALSPVARTTLSLPGVDFASEA